ncbi:MAG: ATP-binding protein, partial [Tahibacter sp.]
VTNLLENSVRYTAAGGRVEVHVATLGDVVQVVIEDTAPGVPETWLPRLGERFFRVESSRNRNLGGAGLGLALCQQILAAHQGRLEFAPSRFGGLRVCMILKRAGAA